MRGRGIRITKGPYTGWLLYGPYRVNKTEKAEYYYLRKGSKKIAVTKKTFNFTSFIPVNDKPFLDFVK